MKKICSILIVAVMLIGMLPAIAIPAFAEVTSGTTGDCAWTLNGTELTISGNGAMGDYDLYYSDNPAPWGTSITKVTIEEGVTHIGDYAFYGCTSLTSVTIPDSVTSIGHLTFHDCIGLISVYIADIVQWCSVKYIFTPTNNPLYYADNLYLNGELVTDLVIPNGVTSIGDYAFFDYDKLSSITIPNSVTSIGYFAFYNCTGLTSVAIGNSVTSIGQYAFYGCSFLEKVNIKDVAAWNNNGLKISEFGSAAKLYLNDVLITDLIIPVGVTKINSSFQGCTSLKSVTFPDSVTTIEGYAFQNCAGITEISLTKNTASIGAYAFDGCTGLKTVKFAGSQLDRSFMSVGGNNVPLNLANWIYDSCGDNHTYTNACDKDCNICKATRTPAAHKGGTATCKEKAKCSVCGVTYGNLAAHKFGDYIYNEDATSQTDGTKTRTCSVCKKTDTVTATGTKLQNPFKDVKSGEYYIEPVLWAVGKKITNGMSETSFAPNNECTRGQIVTFLWRAAGSPEPTSTKNHFVDVKSDQYYYKAVLWAVEKGITTGTSATTFSPDAGCTRGQVVTFLHRAKSKPAANTSNSFTDVKKGAYYYDAVLWAVKNGITNGMGNNKFAPDTTCTRGQIVTFLYRAYN